MLRTRLVVLASLGAATWLMGCSSATPSSEPTGTSPLATAGGTASGSPTPTNTPTRGPMTACAGADLSASGDFGAGAGNDGFLISLTNNSASPCTLSGYLSLVDARGAGPALHVRHGSSMLYADPGTHSVVVAAGMRAYFGIGYAEAGGCAAGGANFHALNIVFASGVLTLPIGAWRQGYLPGVEQICDGEVTETAVSLSTVVG